AADPDLAPAAEHLDADLRPGDAPVRVRDPRRRRPQLHRPRRTPADPGVGRDGLARDRTDRLGAVVGLLLPGPRDRDRCHGLQSDRRRAPGPPRSEAQVMAPILEVRGLRTAFPSASGAVNVLDGVDLEVEDGEILGIVGESGSGKTMTALS